MFAAPSSVIGLGAAMIVVPVVVLPGPAATKPFEQIVRLGKPGNEPPLTNA
ncbi:MAG: hypothetical protein ACK533_08745 [Planctomycetota bacterium]